MKCIINTDCSLGRLNPWNWWKECSWTLIRLKNSLNGQEIGTFEEKRAAAGRRMKSSPILGHPPNCFLTRGRRFQSSPIGRVNRGVGNTDHLWSCHENKIRKCYKNDFIACLRKFYVITLRRGPYVSGWFTVQVYYYLLCSWLGLTLEEVPSPRMLCCMKFHYHALYCTWT